MWGKGLLLKSTDLDQLSVSSKFTPKILVSLIPSVSVYDLGF
jgi:hypothetical protein